MTSGAGDGFPDLCIGWRGVNLLLEVKDGQLAPSRRALTDEQERWHRTWRGQAVIANNIDEAIERISAAASNTE